MVTSRLLGTVGIVAVVGAAVLSAQAPARSATNGPRLAVLPDNPCDLLTREQVAVAAGLPITDITDVQRVPDILALVQAQRDGREPGPGTICSYETLSEFAHITVVVPPAAQRTASSYRQARDKYFSTYPGSGRKISGVGEDAWLAGGAALEVLTRQGETFGLRLQNGAIGPDQSPNVLVALARAVLGRLQ